MSKLIPLHDRLLVKPIADATTVRDIILPDNVKEQPHEGTVISVGKGTTARDGTVLPVGIEPGTIVLFGKGVGSKIHLDGEDFLILKKDEVLGIRVQPINIAVEGVVEVQVADE